MELLEERLAYQEEGMEEKLREVASSMAGYERAPRIGDFLDTQPESLDPEVVPLVTRLYDRENSQDHRQASS